MSDSKSAVNLLNEDSQPKLSETTSDGPLKKKKKKKEQMPLVAVLDNEEVKFGGRHRDSIFQFE